MKQSTVKTSCISDNLGMALENHLSVKLFPAALLSIDTASRSFKFSTHKSTEAFAHLQSRLGHLQPAKNLEVIEN